MRTSGCSNKLERFNSIWRDLVHVLNSSKFPARERGISCRHSNMLMASSCLCALVAPSESIETWVWPSNQNSRGTVRPAYSGEFFAHHDTRAKSSRPCSMVAVLFVREYICKQLSAVWVCELVPYYAPRGWRIKCASKSAWEKKYKSKTKQLQKTEIVLYSTGRT